MSLDARLRVSVAESLDQTGHQSYLDAVNGELNVLSDAVDPVATRRITLASRSTEVPITIHRRIDRPVTVRVHLESPKLSFPDNDVLVTLEADTVQQRISVKARANGTFPLTVSLMTPDGDVAVAPSTELTVHATTLSGFGVRTHRRRAPRAGDVVGAPHPTRPPHEGGGRGAQHHPSAGGAPA